MDDQLSARRVRLRLESLEDRLAPSVSPVFSNVSVADTATTNQTTARTAPVVGVAADGSYVVAWTFNDSVNHDTDIYARQFNSDGTPKAAAFAVANSTANESQPAIAVTTGGQFIIAYTKVITVGTISERNVFFQIFDASGTRTLAETAASSGTSAGTHDDFAPDVAVASSTGQFILVWVQQSSTVNSDVYTRVFQPDGSALTFNDVAVAATSANEFNPHVAVRPVASGGFTGPFLPVISYTLDQGNGVEKVYFRRYSSGLAPLDTGAVGIAVTGNDTSSREDQSAVALDANGNLFIAWTATPVAGGASQVVYQEFSAAAAARFAVPQPIDNNPALNETAPTLALNSDDRILFAYVGAGINNTSPPAEVFYRAFSASFLPTGTSQLFSSNTTPNSVTPRLASSGNNAFALVADDVSGSSPSGVLRGFRFLTSAIGVVRPTGANNLAQFSLDSNGNNGFDSKDSVFTFGFFSDQFVIGDWNGSGYDKIGVVRPYQGVAAVFSLDTNGDGTFDAGDQVFIFGRATDQFLIGDWNGNGVSKIGVVRPSGATAQFSLDTNGDGTFDTGDSVFTFGTATDKFVVGDWNGSGNTKIGVVRPTTDGNLVWSLDSNGDGTFDAGDQVFTFGLSSDQPIVGDWTGSGRSEIGVVRTNVFNNSATVILDSNGDGVMDAGDASFNFGVATDKFVVGKWKGTPLPQLAAQPGPGGAAPLTDAALAATVHAAIDDWAAAGLDAQHLSQMAQVQFHVAQLDNNLLGQTVGNNIDISDTADGWGWYTGTGAPPSNRMDLESTVAHELGHVVGLPDTTNLNDVMADTLSPGTQRLPSRHDVDTLFAQAGGLQALVAPPVGLSQWHTP